MDIDVIVPTFRRPALLRRTLDSLLNATLPAGMTARIIVVDNDPDGAAARPPANDSQHSLPIVWLQEHRAGKSHALNTALDIATADVVAFIDDDEEVERGWFERIALEFARPGTDYLGGRVVPVWQSESPDWRPDEYPGVIGIVESGAEPSAYGPGFYGILTG